jgi:DNA-binding transcriptional LysR family regulator
MNRGNLAELTAFIAVADHLSFRAAASRLGVTPSALSHSMRQLEEVSGCAYCTARRAVYRCPTQCIS